MSLNKHYILLLVMSLVIVISGCVPPESTRNDGTSPRQTANNGQVHIYVTTEYTDQIGSGTFRDRPDAGNQYIIVTFRIVNESNGELNTNSHKFYVVANNVKYSSAFVTQLEGDLDMVDLLPGGEISGSVAFEIPSNCGDVSIWFEPYYNENYEFIWH